MHEIENVGKSGLDAGLGWPHEIENFSVASGLKFSVASLTNNMSESGTHESIAPIISSASASHIAPRTRSSSLPLCMMIWRSLASRTKTCYWEAAFFGNRTVNSPSHRLLQQDSIV